MMQIFVPHEKKRIKTAVFDFDGTISTMRHGWESVMAPLMEEYISGGSASPELKTEIMHYIDESTGIQTIHQMKWLAERVKSYGCNPDAPDDPWFYKDEYNRRLMAEVAGRRDSVLSGRVPRGEYIISGAVEFITGLTERGITLYAASGTDDIDVRAEATALGFTDYFTRIDGAKMRSEGCSKAETLRALIDAGGEPSSIIVIGDGKVEIALGIECGALTLGIASDEDKRYGVNPVKLERLRAAGAHAVTGDFSDYNSIIDWMD